MGDVNEVFNALAKRLKAEPALMEQWVKHVQLVIGETGLKAKLHGLNYSQLLRDSVDPDSDGDGGEPSPGPASPGGGGTPPPPPPPPSVTVEAFVWGFHFVMNHSAVEAFVITGNIVNLFVELVGSATGPAAPFVEAAAQFVQVFLDWVRDTDAGNGVYLSMTWFLPGVFVPTVIT